ncbi:MAG: flagellar basal body rod protein FlgB [Gammaproteobacteria bacterium]|nr:flagellar basal body rod protein FlgB [Gammaproteobacteria bacterium]
MFNLDKAFGIHAQALTARAARAEVLATNLANSDTPGYQARDLDFSTLFSNAGVSLSRTASGHVGGRTESVAGARLVYRTPMQASLDQNTVDPQEEHGRFMQNALQYEASVRLLNGRISGLLSAIRGE